MDFNRLRLIIEDAGLSVRQLALRAEIAPQDLYAALNGTRPFFPGWRRRIAEVLEIDEAELFETGGDDHEES